MARVEAWRPLLDLRHADSLRVLDLGAGTGIFTRAWGHWGASSIVAVDPSLSMLREAARVGVPAQAHLVLGLAERLPLVSRSVDIAWLSAVVHHVADAAACARELARVLTSTGRVYIRGFFAGASRVDWLPYFPGAERAVARFPTVDQVVDVFRTAGFSPLAVVAVQEPEHPVAEVRQWIVKVRHADTLLTALSDDEIAAGLAALDSSDVATLGGSLHLLTLAHDAEPP